MTKHKLVGYAVIILVSNFIHALHSPVMAQEQKFTGSRSEIVGYLYTRINQIVAKEGGPSLQTHIEKYPVLFAGFGSYCEFFLKNTRQDITRGSRLSERVYFKDVTRIEGFRNVPLQSENYGLHVYVGNKRYQINKWSGIATLAEHVKGGDCSRINENDLIYEWPAFHFKVMTGRGAAQWLEADLTSIIEFRYDKVKGALLFDQIQKEKNQSADVTDNRKSFQQLKEDARKKAELNGEERKEKRLQDQSERELNKRAEIFRTTVSEGDDSHCGLVIEVKDKVIKVQTAVGEYWLKRNQLYPPDTKPCNFLNGVYQDP